MAKLRDPKIPERLVPFDQLLLPEGKQVAYLLKIPVGYDRVDLKKAVASRGGRQLGELDLLQAMRKDVDELDPPNAAALASRIKAAIAAFSGALVARKEMALSEGEASGNPFLEAWQAYEAARDGLADIEGMLRTYSGHYGRALGDREVYPLILGIESARKFLVGWENRAGEIKRGTTGVPFEILDTISDAHLVEIGQKVQELMQPTEDEEKNSDSPSPMPSGERISTTAAPEIQATGSANGEASSVH